MEWTDLTSQWISLSDFFAMGGYAPFVWTSVGASALAVVVELVALRSRRMRAERLLADEGASL